MEAREVMNKAELLREQLIQTLADPSIESFDEQSVLHGAISWVFRSYGEGYRFHLQNRINKGPWTVDNFFDSILELEMTYV